MKQRYEDNMVPPGSLAARKEMARQLKEARLGLHLTQQNVADRAGTRKSNISRMESGLYNPSLDFIVKVAETMGKKVKIDIQ